METNRGENPANHGEGEKCDFHLAILRFKQAQCKASVHGFTKPRDFTTWHVGFRIWPGHATSPDKSQAMLRMSVRPVMGSNSTFENQGSFGGLRHLLGLAEVEEKIADLRFFQPGHQSFGHEGLVAGDHGFDLATRKGDVAR